MSDKMCQHCQLDTAGNHQFGCPDASRISVGKIEFEKGTWFSPPLEERILKLESENARLQKENIQLKSVATKWQEKAMEWSKENAELRCALQNVVDIARPIPLTQPLDEAIERAKRVAGWRGGK